MWPLASLAVQQLVWIFHQSLMLPKPSLQNNSLGESLEHIRKFHRINLTGHYTVMVELTGEGRACIPVGLTKT